MVVYRDEPSEPIPYLEPTFLWKALYHHPDRAVTIFLLVCQEPECIDQVVANSLRGSVSSKHFCFSAVRAVCFDQDPIWSLPIVLASARRTPPVALLLSVCRKKPPDVVFKRESVAMRAYIRQDDPSLFCGWHDDPPQQVRACPQIFLYNALPAVIFLLYLVVAFFHFRTCPYAELAISREHFQSALYAWRIGTPSTRKSVLCRKMWSSSFCGVSCCHLPPVPNRLTFSASTKTDLAHAFSREAFCARSAPSTLKPPPLLRLASLAFRCGTSCAG